MGSHLNIFVSRPTVVGVPFEDAYAEFDRFLAAEGLVSRRLGRSDYSKKAPLQAVIDIIDQCCGAIVLGYPQVEFRHEVLRSAQVQSTVGQVFPSPWNQIEGSLAYRCRSPVLVVAHQGITGGVFDHGVTGEMVLHVDLGKIDWFRHAEFVQPYREWLTEVQACVKRRSRRNTASPR